MAAKRASKKTSPEKGPVYRLVIELLDSDIWRQVEIRGSATLAQLHQVIQDAMPWTHSHLHVFELGDVRCGVPHPEDPVEDERRVRLDALLRKVGDQVFYLYDYGDCWEHGIELEAIEDPASGVSYPRCVDGELAAPPDDSGGVCGYEDLLEILADPEHEDYREMRKWVGRGFRPDRFSVAQANRRMARLRG